MHDDELMIDEDLVRSLLRRDLAAYAELPLRPLDSTGSTNRLFRLGEEHLVRLPRQPRGSATIAQEARWLPAFATNLEVATPEVEAVGEPGFGYPERWSVVRWLDGDLLAEDLLARDGRLTAVLDFGALSVGDPTVDLICAWELLDAAGRDEFRRILDIDDATWLRSRGWALFIAVMTFPYYWQTMPVRCADRLVMARAVLEG